MLTTIAHARGATPADRVGVGARTPTVTSVIIGARGLEKLEDNLKSVDVKLEPANLTALDEVSQLAVEYPTWMEVLGSDRPRRKPVLKRTRRNREGIGGNLFWYMCQSERFNLRSIHINLDRCEVSIASLVV